VYWLQVVAVIVTVANSWSFIWFDHFPLLLELGEVLNLGLTEFCEVIIYLRYCFGPFSNQVTIQRSRP
jgi:hypothetical protein